MSEHDPRDDFDDDPSQPRGSLEETVRTAAGLVELLGQLQYMTAVAGCLGAIVAGVWWLIDSGVVRLLWTPDMIAVVAACLLGLGWNVVVRRGAAGMARFQGYRWSLLAAALVVVPVPFVFCGVCSLPIGIWALAVLIRPDVRARFAATARGTIEESRPPAH